MLSSQSQHEAKQRKRFEIADYGAPSSLSVSAVRRLSRSEYAASVKALLEPAGTTEQSTVDAGLLPIDTFTPFDNDASTQDASLALVEAAEALASEQAAWVVQTKERRDRIIGCTPASSADVECFDHFLDTFGRGALRRPLRDEERAAFHSFLSFAGEDDDFSAAIQAAIAVLLAHPEFIYRVEQSGSDLNDFEWASRVAFFLTGRGPPSWLLDAAASGFRGPVESKRAVAQRLLDEPAAHTQLARYHAMWLGYERFSDEFPYGDMRQESNALVERVVFAERDYRELLTSNETFLTPALAQHYGVAAVDKPAWINVRTYGRAGVLSHASALAAGSNSNDTSPTRRGKFIRNRLLCDTVPPPPPTVDVDAPPKSADKNACKEERYRAHREDANCASCHALMDPIGFGLERYDKLGAYRTHDDSRESCALSGDGTIEGIGSFNGPAELGELVATTDRFDSCVTRHQLSFALGRQINPANADDAALERVMTQRFVQSGRRLPALLLDIVTSEAFSTRAEGTL